MPVHPFNAQNFMLLPSFVPQEVLQCTYSYSVFLQVSNNEFHTMHFQQCVSKPFAVTHRACKHTLCIYCSEKSKVSILVVSLEAVVEGWEEATTLTLARVSPCCLGLGLCVLRADFLRQLAHGGRAESSSPGLQPCYTGLRPSSVPP